MTSPSTKTTRQSCPAGSTRPISATRIATFGALCRDCPLRQRCTTSKTGRKIVLHERDDLLRRARRDWKDNSDLRERYRRHRPNIARVDSQIASRGGHPRTPLVSGLLGTRVALAVEKLFDHERRGTVWRATGAEPTVGA